MTGKCGVRHIRSARRLHGYQIRARSSGAIYICLLYTFDAADDLLCVALGGRRIIKKKSIFSVLVLSLRRFVLPMLTSLVCLFPLYHFFFDFYVLRLTSLHHLLMYFLTH